MRIAIYQADPFEAKRMQRKLNDVGHQVFVEASRYDLLSLLDRSTMDLVLTEWHGMLGLHTISGHWLIREARNAAVIFTTTEDELPEIQRSSDGHMVAFLHRPVTTDQLTKAVSVMIQRAFPWQSTAQFDVGPFSINLVQRTIHRDGKPLPSMNDATFRLAYCLLVNAGRRLSRDYIRDFVGGTAAVSQSRYVDTLVGTVRKLLLSRTRTGLRIRAVYGFGYILELGKESPAVRMRELLNIAMDESERALA